MTPTQKKLKAFEGKDIYKLTKVELEEYLKVVQERKLELQKIKEG